MVDIGELHMVVSIYNHTYEIMRILRFGAFRIQYELFNFNLKKY